MFKTCRPVCEIRPVRAFDPGRPRPSSALSAPPASALRARGYSICAFRPFRAFILGADLMLEPRKSLKLAPSATPFRTFRAGSCAPRALVPRFPHRPRNLPMILVHFSNPPPLPRPPYGRVTGP